MKVKIVLHRWCSCGCCVPYGTGNGEYEAPADMAEVVFEDGTIATVSGYPEEEDEYEEMEEFGLKCYIPI